MQRLSVLVLILLIDTVCGWSQGWELDSSADGIQVYARQQDDQRIKRIKVAATIDAPFAQVVNAIQDVTNMPAWYDKVADVDLVSMHGPQQLDLSLVIDLPWPLRDRITYLAARGDYNGDTQTLYVTTKYEPTIAKDAPDGQVLVTEMGSSWTIVDSDQKSTYAEHEVYIDPAGILPAWLVNMTATEGPRRTMEELRRVIQQYPEELPPSLEKMRVGDR